MKLRHQCILAATLSICLMSACTDEGEEVEAAMTFDELNTRINSLFVDYQCERTFQCPETQGSSLFIYGRFQDEAECKTTLIAELAQRPNFIKMSIEAGRLRYNQAQSLSCITALEAIVQDDLCTFINHDDDDDNGRATTGFIPSAACPELWTGLVNAGGKCLYSQECATGLECEYTGGSCYGTCAARPCSDCTDAQYCGEENGQPTCKPRSPLGADCTENICAKGATCLIKDAQVGKCTADRSVDAGGACNEDIQCKIDLCGEDGLCDATPSTPTLSDSGEACGLSQPCKPGLTCQDLVPDTGKAQCKVAITLGAACSFTQECEYGLFCQGAAPDGMTKGNCAMPLPDGQTCVYHQDCQSRFCDYDDKKCSSETLCTI